MGLNIRPSTSIERKLIFLETLINVSDKVSKVSPDSVLQGVATGVAKISGKAEKDIILTLSQLFPDTAYGSQLDQVAENFGLSSRFTSSGSSTYVRLSGDPGTIYNQALHTFQSTSGIVFELEDSIVTIPTFGFTYAKVRSITTGQQTNVDPLTITKVNPQPTGHLNVINEVSAFGGRDEESDELYRIRIKDGSNILARGTIAMLEQKFMSVNSKVLKCFYQGINEFGKIRIAIVTQNGQALSTPEIDQLLLESGEYFTFTDHRPFGDQIFYGVELINIVFQPVDISFRVELDTSYNADDIRKNIQVRISKYLDHRFFDTSKQKVEWDDLLQIVKSTLGVKYVPDQYFFPDIDQIVDEHKLPRLRGFLMLDLDGNIIQNLTGSLSPVYYPNEVDFSYQQTVLNNI